MKGIILAGGTGKRLFPLTKSVSKQLMPVYDKPLIHYSLSTLLLTGIKDILLITNEENIDAYKNLLADGSQLGIKISYKIQSKPKGISEAFIIGENFIGNEEKIALILGDNIFFGQGFSEILNKKKENSGATVFTYPVNNPSEFGILYKNSKGKPSRIVEKPKLQSSNLAVTGLYFYDNSVIEKAYSLKPSKRGELEISDLNNLYLSEKNLNIAELGRGMVWMDCGNPKNLLEASNLIASIQSRQKFKVGCIEEIAISNGWISKRSVLDFLDEYPEEVLNYIKNLP